MDKQQAAPTLAIWRRP